LAGKEVIVARSTGKGLDVETGRVTRVNFSGGQFQITVNGKEFPLQNMMEVLDHNNGRTDGNDGAFATSLIGKYVTVGWTSNIGEARKEEGIVERIEIDSGQITVIIDGLSYPLQSVVRVEPSPPVEEEDIWQPGGAPSNNPNN
jgi:hypothetical protein